MSATVKVNTAYLDKLANKLSDSQLERTLPAVADQMLSDMTPFTPFKDGTLANSGVVNGTEISWNTPYAAKWFYTKANFNRSGHPHATNRWDLAAASRYSERWNEILLKEIEETL